MDTQCICNRSTEADPDVEEMQRSSISTLFALQKTFLASTMSLWWKETNAQPFLRLIVPYESLHFIRERERAVLIKKTDLLLCLSVTYACESSVNFIPQNNAALGFFLALKPLKIKHNAVFFHRQEDLNEIQMN